MASKGKVMTQDKPEQHVIFASIILLLLFAGLTLFIASIARANPEPDAAASSATYRAKCAACHGPDGGGSEIGKSMPVPDLRLQAVQKQTDAELAQTIHNGKGGMPAFKDLLREDQIHALVTHIRTRHQKK